MYYIDNGQEAAFVMQCHMGKIHDEKLHEQRSMTKLLKMHGHRIISHSFLQ